MESLVMYDSKYVCFFSCFFNWLIFKSGMHLSKIALCFNFQMMQALAGLSSDWDYFVMSVSHLLSLIL